MRLKLSAVVLSVSLLGAAPLFAQSSPETPATPANHLFPGGHGVASGFHGEMGHLPPEVTNAPFTAQFTVNAERSGDDAKQIATTRTVYRDSLGRTREDVTLPPRPPRAGAVSPQTPDAPRTMTVIFDPVANTVTRLMPERKIAVVDTLPAGAFKHADMRESREEQGRFGTPRAQVIDLGSKSFAGVVAKGEKITHTFTPHDGGEVKIMTREVWFSPDLKLEVSSTETSDHGSRSTTLASLSKGEPDASLFKTPSDYIVKQGSELHGGAHGHSAPVPPSN